MVCISVCSSSPFPSVLPRTDQEGACLCASDPIVSRPQPQDENQEQAGRQRGRGTPYKNEKKSDFVTIYCYSDEERQQAIRDLGPDPEITRFKGLGEISPDEFSHFIGPDMRLEQVTLHKNDQVQKLLEYYMGKIRWKDKTSSSTTW